MQPHEITFDLNDVAFRDFIRGRYGDCVGVGHVPQLQYATDDELRAGKYLPNPGCFQNGLPLDQRARDWQVEFTHYSRRKFERIWIQYQAFLAPASATATLGEQFALI